MFEREKVETTVKVVNVVATATLGERVNLKAIIDAFSDAKFPSDKFPGVVLRTKRPRTANLIFSSGKIVCTGGKSEVDARKALKSIVRELIEESIISPKEMIDVKINNIVVSGNLTQTVDLELLSKLHGAMYEPEQFPALIYRIEKPKVVFLIFPSGKVVCVGAKNQEDVHYAFKNLIERIKAVNSLKLPSSTMAEAGFKELEASTSVRVALRDFAFSDGKGKACTYVDGLWCSNKLCEGPPCKFANLIEGKLFNGLYGCWGFDWQQGWYGLEVKRSQRRFNN